MAQQIGLSMPMLNIISDLFSAAKLNVNFTLIALLPRLKSAAKQFK